MKLTIFEHEYGTDFRLVPETLEETSLLLRMAMHQKKEPAYIRVNVPTVKDKNSNLCLNIDFKSIDPKNKSHIIKR